MRFPGHISGHREHPGDYTCFEMLEQSTCGQVDVGIHEPDIACCDSRCVRGITSFASATLVLCDQVSGSKKGSRLRHR